MWSTPSSTARRRTAIASSRRRGAGSQGIPVRRIAPRPIRLTVRSPSCQVPAALASRVVVVMVVPFGGGSDREREQVPRRSGDEACAELPEPAGGLGVDGVRGDPGLRVGGAGARVERGDVAVGEVDAAAVLQQRAGGGDEDGGGTLVDGLAARGRVD